MPATIFKKKWQKMLFIVITSVIALILILALVINQYWSPILSDKVKSAVESSSDGLYTVSFSDAKLHVLKGEIVIYNIDLKPDTAVYNQRRQLHLAPNNLVELKVKRLVLSHIHPLRLYFRHKLDIGTVILSRPEVKITYAKNHTKDTTTNDNRTPWQRLSKTLKSVHIGSILFNDVNFKYEDYSGHKVAISELKEMNLTATDLLIDSATQTDKSRLLYCRDIVTELNNYSGQSPNGLYQYKFKYLKLSTRDSKLKVTGLDFKPVKPNVFFQKTVHDRFAVHVDSLELNHFDFLSYHKFRVFNAGSLNIISGGLNIFANPNPSPDQTDKVKTFPSFKLQQISNELTIDTINLKHINVVYNEFNSKSKQTGTIQFDNSSGRILNVTTNKSVLQRNNISTVQLSSYFMGRARFDVKLNFNLTSKDFPFTYKGHVAPMDLKLLNPATMPLALFKVNKGNLTGFDFDIKADKKVFKGTVSLRYTDLKIKVLKADTDNMQYKRKTLASLYANAIVIKHNNPDNAGEVPRTAYVTYERSEESPFFKTIWKTLLSGIKPCIGLDEKMQQAVRVKMAQQITNKLERAVRKAERKQRRAERKKKAELQAALKKEKESNTEEAPKRE